MIVRPVPLLTQVCADEFALRRLARVAAGGAWSSGIACTCVVVDARHEVAGHRARCWSSGSVIFFAVFIGFACIQFWTIDAAEVANAFTYGGNTITQYPLTLFPSEMRQGR